jgi:hypothetical protein
LSGPELTCSAIRTKSQCPARRWAAGRVVRSQDQLSGDPLDGSRHGRTRWCR